MAIVQSSSSISNNHVMFLAPNWVFNTKLYVEYKNELVACKVTKITNSITDDYYCHQSVHATLANGKRIIFHLFNGFKSVEDFKNNNIAYSCNSGVFSWGSHQTRSNIGGTKIDIATIINHYIAPKPFCSYTNYSGGIRNYIVTYKWNGTRCEDVKFNISNTIIQTENEIYFEDLDIKKEWADCYLTKEECEKSNSIKIVDFDDEEEEINTIQFLDETKLTSILKSMTTYLESLDAEDKVDYLHELATTGLFHDAVGKVLATERNKIKITIEY